MTRTKKKKLSKAPPVVIIPPVARLRLHNHPRMESELRVPEGHVIIDADVFF